MIARFLFYLHQLRRNMRLKPGDLRQMQLKKVRAIIEHAYKNVPFYRRKFDKAGVKPSDVKSLSDLTKIPLTTKAEVQAGSLSEFVARNTDINTCIKRATSGSTGIPLTTLIDGRGFDFEAAVSTRALLENGLRLRDRMAVMSDPRHFPGNIKWFQRLGIMRREYISIFDDPQSQYLFLKKLQPDIIKGYSSALTILTGVCTVAHEIRPHLIFTGAEFLDSRSRALINSAFGADVLDNYGCREFGLLAWECSEHSGYHINLENVFMELVKNGESVGTGERGRIVCTGLANYAMPLIRYDLGDVGTLFEGHCPCGRPLPLMKIIEGRMDDFLIALDGRIVSPTVIFPYPFENIEMIRQFRIVQERQDKLTIQLAMKKGFYNEAIVFEKAKKRLQRLFGEEMQVEFQILEEIPRDESGKLRKTVSLLKKPF